MSGRSQLIRAKYVKGEATLEKIREACLEEIIAFGYQRTSVCEIVRRANLTRGAFYNYWTSLDDCLADLISNIRELVQTDEDAVEFSKTIADDPSATVRKIRLAFYSFEEKQSRFLLLPLALLQEKNIANEELKNILRDYLMRVKGEYVEVIQADQEAGIIDPELEADVLAVALMNFFKGIFEKNVLAFDEFRVPIRKAMMLFLESSLSTDYLKDHPIQDVFELKQDTQPAAPA